MTSMTSLLEIQDLHAGVGEKTILQGISLSIEKGKVHAIMGPNGSGKSSLAGVLARKPEIQVTQGSVQYNGENLLNFKPEEAAQKGIFLGFQYPVAIPGITNIQFLKFSLNAVRQAQNKALLDAVDFLKLVKEKMQELAMPEELLYRPINEGFSGGEKKRNEMLQMTLLEPQLAVLDETDSGLDIDALKTVAHSINQLRSKNRSIILITHYQRLLEYVEPDFIHVLANGKIVFSGDKTLSQTLEAKGYRWIEETA